MMSTADGPHSTGALRLVGHLGGSFLRAGRTLSPQRARCVSQRGGFNRCEIFCRLLLHSFSCPLSVPRATVTACAILSAVPNRTVAAPAKQIAAANQLAGATVAAKLAADASRRAGAVPSAAWMAGSSPDKNTVAVATAMSPGASAPDRLAPIRVVAANAASRVAAPSRDADASQDADAAVAVNRAALQRVVRAV